MDDRAPKPIEVTRGAASPEEVAVIVALLGAGRSAAAAAADGRDSCDRPGDGYRAWRHTRLAALRRDVPAPE